MVGVLGLDAIHAGLIYKLGLDLEYSLAFFVTSKKEYLDWNANWYAWYACHTSSVVKNERRIGEEK